MATPDHSIAIHLNSSKPSKNISKHSKYSHGWTNEIEADFKNLIDYIRSNSELFHKKAYQRSLCNKFFVISATVSSVVGAVCSSSSFLSCSTSSIITISTCLTTSSLTLLNSMFNFPKQQIVLEQMAEALDNLARRIQVELYKPPASRTDPLTFSLEIESVETKIMKRESELTH
jgi:hypothetical protein